MITTVMLSDQPFHDDGTLWPLAELAEVATEFRVIPRRCAMRSSASASHRMLFPQSDP